ncbi:hypothetical protein [Microbacterium algeriense]|uniref:hypothetical protein n=1 Tax=Microbacterium algeriense TaxID=2615184 RepID=UPI0029BE3A6B|nr:hypothetical protein [Microbacterium algeriense]MDX2400270.1 hypothetical protein [Microbacterium algeriense]
MPTDTLLLDRSTVQAVVDTDQLTEQLGSALVKYVGAGAPQRVRSRLSAELTAMVLMPGLADGVPAYTVKVHAKNPDADEAIRGLMLLHDLPGGALLAVIESGWLTAQRTALTAAFVHDRLTSHSPGSIGIIGAGAQGTATALALSRRRGGHFTIYDSDQRRALALQQALGAAHADVAPSSEAAVRASSSAVTATWGRRPVASTPALQGLDHVTVLGMDEPGKQELPPDFLNMATVYADDPALVRPIIRQTSLPISAALREDAPTAWPSVYIAAGLPLQDCVAAWHVYQRAGATGRGRNVDFRG